MKILYLLRTETDDTLDALMAEHRRNHDVTVYPLGESVDYDRLVDLVFENDKIISW